MGIEITYEMTSFLILVPYRSQITLINIILQHAYECLILIAGLWKGDNWIEEHYTVNHSKNLISQDNKSSTNTINGIINAVKYYIKAGNGAIKVLLDLDS